LDIWLDTKHFYPHLNAESEYRQLNNVVIYFSTKLECTVIFLLMFPEMQFTREHLTGWSWVWVCAIPLSMEYIGSGLDSKSCR